MFNYFFIIHNSLRMSCSLIGKTPFFGNGLYQFESDQLRIKKKNIVTIRFLIYLAFPSSNRPRLLAAYQREYSNRLRSLLWE